MERPADMFDRTFEWQGLVDFVTDESDGASLGVVSGRRRQGKSYLLKSLCEAAGGFYFAATEATETESLQLLADAIAAYTGTRLPIRFERWEDAIDALLSLGEDRPVPVVLDEFPYLCKSSPSLPSIIQKAYGPRRKERLRSRTRLLLCGSAISFMGQLLSGSAPLRGRAGLDLRVHTFDYRLAAEFWGIDDWRLAAQVYAIVGGTPAYRREFVSGDAPRSLSDFDAWVERTVLNPLTPLFREARYLLSEEADLRDRALYHTVLAAIADGNHSRGGIASYAGRSDDVLGHPLLVLQDSGLVAREDDAFRQKRKRYRIVEPLIDFYHAVMRPSWPQLEHSGAHQVWQRSKDRFSTHVLGPRFEEIAREWVRAFADPETLGDFPREVTAGVVNDPSNRTTHELDVVALGPDDQRRKRILALGEATWGRRLGTRDLDRLREVRALLEPRTDVDVADTRLLCVSGVGFTDELVREAAGSTDVALVDTERLYTGS